MLESKVDVAVRLGAPRASSFVVRKLAAPREPFLAALRDQIARDALRWGEPDEG